jgi:hypothetical protein
MRVKVSGINKVKKINNTIINAEFHDKLLGELMAEAADLIRKYAPRKTGALEGSIKAVKLKNNEYIIMVNVPYAKYMEYGTKYFKVGTVKSPRARLSSSGKPCYHPFIRPVIWDIMNRFPTIMQQALFKKI